MRGFTVLFLSLCLEESECSAVVSDLALMAHGHQPNPAAVLGPHKEKVAIDESVKKLKSMVMRSDMVDEDQPRKTEESDEPGEALTLWRVRILLAVIIVSIVAALAIAVVHTARVFGILPDFGSSKSVASSPKDEGDPESLKRLLSSQTGEGFGAIFASRGYFPTSSEEKRRILIQ
jgi:hypothetical protein